MGLKTLLVWAVVSGVGALAQAQGEGGCRVNDPEIRGSYEGGCNAQGLAQGKGVAVGAVARYEGEFAAGSKHGQGRKQWLQSGDHYSGSFANDHRHGQGTYTWAISPQASRPRAVQRYFGEFDRDQRHGYGVFEWPNGDRYAGPWARDQQIGPLTPMQRIRRQYDDQLAQRIAKPGAAVCAVAHGSSRATVVGYELGELLLRPSSGGADTVQRAPIRDWGPCP